MTKTFKACIAVAVVSLAGCVPPGSRQSGPTAQDDPSAGCMASLAYDARFVPLREKIAINLPPTRPSLEMLADKSSPTDEERRLISVWKVARDTCADMGAGFRAQYAPPTYRANIDAAFSATNSLIGRLYSGDINYGEFNRMRADSASARAAEGARDEERLREASAQQEAQRRLAVGQALQNMQTQQMLNQQILNQQIIQQPRPTTTNCNRFGNQVNCTTY